MISNYMICYSLGRYHGELEGWEMCSAQGENEKYIKNVIGNFQGIRLCGGWLWLRE
jgi:hypothetical protein